MAVWASVGGILGVSIYWDTLGSEAVCVSSTSD